MRALFWGGWVVAVLCGVVGWGLWKHSQRWPYYIDSPSLTGPGCVKSKALALLGNATYDSRNLTQSQRAWFAGIQKLETPRKRYADRGIGLMALGIGIAGAVLGGVLYLRRDVRGRRKFLFTAWVLSWLVLIPGSFWFYGYHAMRGDYPWFSDSLGIPFFDALITTPVGCGMTFFLLRELLGSRELPVRLGLVSPNAAPGWVRLAFLGLWIGLMFLDVYAGIAAGDPGAVAGQLWAACLLLLVFSAKSPLQTDPA